MIFKDQDLDIQDQLELADRPARLSGKPTGSTPRKFSAKVSVIMSTRESQSTS